MKCRTCHWFATFSCSGLCTNPVSPRLGEYVGGTDSCTRWEKRREDSVEVVCESRKMCDRCIHTDVCGIGLKEYLLVSEVLHGKTPVCKHFAEAHIKMEETL